MRICYEPKVFLVSRPQIDKQGVQAFLDEMGLDWPTPTEDVKDCERVVELAGRSCYMSFGSKAASKTNQAYVDNLVGVSRPGIAHGSVCEHPHWTFQVTGASRGFSHEQVRHRVGVAYSQLSTRYCDFERSEVEDGTWDPGFCVPPLAQLSEETKQFFVRAFEEERSIYAEALALIERDLVKQPEFMAALDSVPLREKQRALRKAARGAARELLPNATEAVMTITANARSIWNMAVMRASPEAEAVIRIVYCKIVEIMEKEMPALFNNVVYKRVWDGTMAVQMPREKL
jgi:thymidylate synthase (FAD)